MITPLSQVIAARLEKAAIDNGFDQELPIFPLEDGEVHWRTVRDARRIIETWRIHFNRVRPHSSLGYQTPEQFRLASETGSGKSGHSVTLENSPSFPLSQNPDCDDNSLNSSLSGWS